MDNTFVDTKKQINQSTKQTSVKKKLNMKITLEEVQYTCGGKKS